MWLGGFVWNSVERRKIEIFEDFQTEIFGFKMCLYKFMHCTDVWNEPCFKCLSQIESQIAKNSKLDFNIFVIAIL